MRRIITALVAMLMLVLAGSAGAVVYGEPDGNPPECRGALAPQAYSDGTGLLRTLISPTVFLTAALHWAFRVSLVRLGLRADTARDGTSRGPAVQRYRRPHDIAWSSSTSLNITPRPPDRRIACNLPSNQLSVLRAQSVTIDHPTSIRGRPFRRTRTPFTNNRG